jgi:hypothetical protein
MGVDDKVSDQGAMHPDQLPGDIVHDLKDTPIPPGHTLEPAFDTIYRDVRNTYHKDD